MGSAAVVRAEVVATAESVLPSTLAILMYNAPVRHQKLKTKVKVHV